MSNDVCMVKPCSKQDNLAQEFQAAANSSSSYDCKWNKTF